MTGSPHGERPLSDEERRALERIEEHVRDTDPEFPQRLGSHPGRRHPALRHVGRRPRAWEVAAVVAAAALYISLLFAVPVHLVVEIVVLTQVVLIPGCCLLWAARRGEL